jgi:hypothetical protein
MADCTDTTITVITFYSNGDVMQNQRGDLQPVTVEWLLPVPWQLWATLEFPYHATQDSARRKFDEMANLIERGTRTRLCYVYAAEQRDRSGVVRVPLHIHAAFASLKILTPQLVRGMWIGGVGRRDSEDSDLAVVKPFDPSKDGLAYIVKQIGYPDTQLRYKYIDRFRGEPLSDRVQAREARRWEEQLEGIL